MIKVNKKIISIVTIFTMSLTMLVSCNNSNTQITEYKSMNENEGEFLDNIDMLNAMENIHNLSDDIGVRVTGFSREKKAAKYIEEQFEKMGYTTRTQEFMFLSLGFQRIGKSRNIEAVKKPSNKDDNDTNEIVYVTAHYDSVKKSPGANDNGSGVVAMLEIANAIKDLDVDKEIRFVAFGAEEIGLKGSENYVKNLSEDEISRSIACFNLDMVATAYEIDSELGVYTADGQPNIVTDAVKASGEELKSLSTDFSSYDGEIDNVDGKGEDCSDHASFTDANIPAALFININPNEKNMRKSLEPYYHTKDDNTSNFSYERLERSIKLVGNAVYDMVNDKNNE